MKLRLAFRFPKERRQNTSRLVGPQTNMTVRRDSILCGFLCGGIAERHSEIHRLHAGFDVRP